MTKGIVDWLSFTSLAIISGILLMQSFIVLSDVYFTSESLPILLTYLLPGLYFGMIAALQFRKKRKVLVLIGLALIIVFHFYLLKDYSDTSGPPGKPPDLSFLEISAFMAFWYVLQIFPIYRNLFQRN